MEGRIEKAEILGHNLARLPVPDSPRPGRPIPSPIRSRMERAFRADFSTVRIREGMPARAAGVRAYTRGEDVHVSPGALRTETEGGQELLGHELAHVLQQRDGLVSPGTAGALEGAAEQAGARAARGLPVSSIDRDAAPPSPASPGPQVLVQAGGSAQAGSYPIGEPPGGGKTDTRKSVDAFHQGGDVYLDADSNRYKLVTTSAGDHLERVSSKDTDTSLKRTSDQSLESLLGGEKATKASKSLGSNSGKVLERPIYKKAMKLAKLARSGDPQAQMEVENLGRINDPRHPDHLKSKEKQDGMIRDSAKKRKADKRGTGNDEGQQTFLFQTALTRDSGLSKDPGIRTEDTGKGGQTVTRLDFHQYNRTPTGLIPLIGGPDHNHPGVATSTPGGQDHLSKGNHDLDSSRAQEILSHHGPATEFGASLVAQVQQMKPPRDVIDPTKIMGYDTQGRDFATNEDARQDLAYESGRNREIMKRIAKELPQEYSGLSDIGEDDLSSDDDTFQIDPLDVQEVLKDPSKLPLLYSSYEHPKPRPSGYKYVTKKVKI